MKNATLYDHFCIFIDGAIALMKENPDEHNIGYVTGAICTASVLGIISDEQEKSLFLSAGIETESEATNDY